MSMKNVVFPVLGVAIVAILLLPCSAFAQDERTDDSYKGNIYRCTMNTFQSEDVDDVWANESFAPVHNSAERALERVDAAFERNVSGNFSGVDGVDCQANICRIVIAFKPGTSGEEVEAVADSLPMVHPFKRGKARTFVFKDSDGYRVETFFAKPGYTIPTCAVPAKFKSDPPPMPDGPVN